jgi:hypothetical protein
MSSSDQQVVTNPTYMTDIRFFFRPVDVEHMVGHGIDLSTYAGVKRRAVEIYFETKQPGGDMPPDAAGQWSSDRSQTFENWIRNGCPLGLAAANGPAPAASDDAGADAIRVRKNITSLSSDELDALKKAFSGLMERDPSQPDSYFALAGIHGLPQLWCEHHVDPFNPWHRAYLKLFEDQLRAVPGCENVTLPYWAWDSETPLPDVLQQPPFDSYTLHQDPGAGATPPVSSGYPIPYTTQRNDAKTILDNMRGLGVFADTATSLKQSRWGAYYRSFFSGGYQKFSMMAHDGGHNSIGPTMTDQHVASYDPIFWFFHANIDRLWLGWQHLVGATTLAGFKSTVDDASWLSPPINGLQPFQTTSDEAITLAISYDELPVRPEAAQLENKVGSIDAASTFSIKRSSPVSVRVKGINRLNIPGSFTVTLLADGEPIARRAFFQSKRPTDCRTCREQALVDLDFRLDPETILDRKLSMAIDVAGHEEIGHFPLSQAGNPTINARLLLDEE